MTTTTTDQHQQKNNKEENVEKRCHIENNYVGQQKKSVRHGYGVYTYTNRFFKYEGEWIDGKKHGLGKLLMNDGSYYNGEFKNGEIVGNGLRYFGLNGNKYTGTFQKGELHGQGIMKYKNGSVYEGSWVYNKRQGHGILKEKDGATYDGTFHQHKKHGLGTQNYQNGDIYIGEWGQGQRQGHGRVKTSDGTFYEGQWANDVMSGMGNMKHSSGIVYEGHWINGLPQALATKLVFVPNQEVLFIDKEKSFNIEIQCRNDDKELIPEQGRKIQLIAGMQHQATQNTSFEKDDNLEDLENILITTPYGYSILPCPLNIMPPLEQMSTNENTDENDPEKAKSAVPDPLPLPEEMTIQRTTDGKVAWQNLLRPSSDVEKDVEKNVETPKTPKNVEKNVETPKIPQEYKKKPPKNVAAGTATPKAKKDNLVPEIEEKLGEFILVAKDVTDPPFMNQRLQTAFLKIKLYQQKTKFARK